MDDNLALLKFLQKELKTKNAQINKLLERQRETNILMGQLQNKVFLLEDKSKGKKQRTEDTTQDRTGDKIRKLINRIFKREEKVI